MMTDAERQKLCADLRAIGPLVGKGAVWDVADHAADEIERLHGESDWLRTALRAAQTAPAQSDAEPVAWQLVPKEPTPEMLDAGARAPDGDSWPGGSMANSWEAMLIAAPASPRPRSG